MVEDIVLLAAVALVAGGCALIYIPAGLIALGALLAAYVLLREEADQEAAE